MSTVSLSLSTATLWCVLAEHEETFRAHLAEVVGEIPGAQLARLQADQQIVAAALGVPLTRVRAEVPRRDPQDDRSVFQPAEARRPAYLDAAVGRALFAHHDARALIPTKVARLRAPRPGDHLEAVVAPLVPDRREEHGPVRPVRGEHGQERQLEQVPQVVRRQPFAHAPSLSK